MTKKYELLKSDTIKVNNKTLYRVKALRSFSDIDKGDLGGYIEHEGNLSHEEDAWVFGNAEVSGNAVVNHTTDIITFNFGEYHCTATRSDMSCQIGCMRHTIDEWLSLSEEDAWERGTYNVEKYKSFLQFCKLRFNKLNKEEQ